MADYKPVSGEKVYTALRDKDCIVMAANMRFIPGIADGVLRAAKDTNTPVIIEIARSESDLKGGYTGYTPKDFAERIMAAAARVQCDTWILHADHIGIKDGNPETIQGTKDLVKAQIDAGFTSFAIDASHIFNFEGKDEKEELAGNLLATIEVAKFIQDELKKKGITSYGLEVEVGEVGRKSEEGLILTTPGQASTFITELNKAGVYPQLLATANGTVHGNVYDDKGQKVAKVGIDIPRTKAIAAALRQTGTTTRIAQHGITGTPLKWIQTLFPRGDVLKGNVGTFWQDVFFTVIDIYEPALYKKMWDWTQTTYAGKGKSPEEIFGKNCKNAFKPFFAETHSFGPDTLKALEAKAYAEALIFFKAFNSLGKASLIK
jgi:fructose-bisphosphate aldolase class II